MKERIATGIKNFDNLIKGGFEKNSINIISGNSGSGKSIFSTQFLIYGMKKDENCLYITFEEKKEQFYEHMKQFSWDLQKYEDKGLFTFLEYTPSKVKAMLEEGGGAIETVILKKKISRIVIDSLTSFALLFEDELQQREAALLLFNMLKDWNCTSLLTLELEQSGKGVINASETLGFESDSIMRIYEAFSKGERRRYFEVLKMRGTEHSRKIFELKIDKSGILIASSPCTNPPGL